MYSIKELAMFTGLSDRTLRNYLEAGILQGDKSSGMWRFTEEQIGAFLQNNTVKSAIQAKNRALVTDFMADTHKKENAVCMIWDLPQADATTAMHFICNAVNGKESLEMSFEKSETRKRIILRGKEEAICQILLEYRSLFGKDPRNQQEETMP